MAKRALLLSACAALLSAASAGAAPPDSVPGNAGMFGQDRPFGVSDLPASRLRSRLQSLPPKARARALDWLHEFSFPAADANALEIDPEGGVVYVCEHQPADEPEAGDAELVDADAIPLAAAEDPFGLHSRPGARNQVYLDFTGHTVTKTAWNVKVGIDPLIARPFDLDGSPSTFGAAERAAIAEIWHRVAEDYAAFDIDVTTEEPAKFGPTVGRVLITGKTDANGKAMPSNTAGGVAYVGVWGSSSYASYYSPALVYYENLSKVTTYTAEACAHELGHNLGLSHDGSASTTYYAGHGTGYISWAPIMGNSYYNNVTQWSKGEYTGANNIQDDVAIVGGKLGLSADDHGDTPAAATALLISGTGEIQVSNPETDPQNLYPENKGAIDRRGDLDVFAFNTEAGPVELAALPAWDAFYRTSKRGANLDLVATLTDARGTKLAESNPTTDTYASVAATVPAGTYYLSVRASGSANYSDYASQGQYFISGQITTEALPNQPPGADFSYACVGTGCSFTVASTDSDGTIASRAWNFGDGATAAGVTVTHDYAALGTYRVTLTVADDDGASASTARDVPVTPANVAPAATFGLNCNGLDCAFTDRSTDGDGAIVSWQWDFGDGTSSDVQHPSHRYVTAGNYVVTLTVADDDGAPATATANAAPSLTTLDPPPPLLDADFASASLAGWSIVDQGTVDAPSLWSASTGVLVQSSNIYSGSGTDAVSLPKLGTYAVYDGGYAWTDYRATLTPRSDDDDAVGLMFRVQDSSNYYRFSWDNQRSYRRLVKSVGGVFTQLASHAAPYVQGRTYQLDILVQGSLIEVRIDGTLILSVTDAALTEGTIAAYAWGNVGARFDDLVVTNLSSVPPPLLYETFAGGSLSAWTVSDEGTIEGPSSWAVTSGVLVQSRNIYGGDAFSGSDLPKPGTYLRYDQGSTWSDYRARFKLRSDDDDAIGLMFRVADNSNYYRFSWDQQRNYRRLVKKVNGSFTLLAEDSVPYETGRTYDVEIDARGDRIEVRIDGEVALSATDASLTEGTIAFYCWGNVGSRFDDLLVTN